MQKIDAAHAATVQATLGEGPVWVERDQCFWFVDIKEHRIHRYDPAGDRIRTWQAPDSIGWLVPAEENKFLAGSAKGLYCFDQFTGHFEHLHAIEASQPDNRVNDGTIDVHGRVWFGTMDNLETTASGRFYRYQDGVLHDCGIEPVCITNGPAASPDGKTLYTVDTLALAIDAHGIDDDGHLRQRSRFLTFDASLGYPDGVVCDAEGGLWVCFWSGYAARRYDARGTLTHEARFPVANVTKIALGGYDGCTAFATTARKGLSCETLALQPHAGDVFSFRVDVPGLVTPQVGLRRQVGANAKL